MCRKIKSDQPAKGGEAWFHPHPGAPPRESRATFAAGNGKPRAEPKASATDWGRLAAAFKASLDAHPAQRRELAGALRLPADALARLPLIGWNSADAPFWSLPEVDASGAVVGINRRYADGDKRHYPGSRRGLTVPDGWADRPGPVYVCEGASDVLAMSHAGLPCVGRFNNSGGADLLAQLFADLPPDRDIIVLGENDQKPNGDWPGRDGAVGVAAKLRAALPGRTVRVALPPDGAKDARQWLTHADRAETPWPDRGAGFAAGLAFIVAEEKTPPAVGGGRERAPAAADVLAAIAAEGELFHDAAQVAYAAVGPRTYPVRSKAFRLHLVGEFHERTGKVPGGEAITSALAAAESRAVRRGAERPVFVRVAGHAGKVYYHVGDDDTTVYEIDADGWRVVAHPPVRFLKPSGMLAVPMPVPGGDFAGLRQFVNCPGAAEFALLRGWVAAALNPGGPFPVLGVTGEQGSAKTTTTKVVKLLLDPAAPPTRSSPREERDLQVAARRSWVLAFDNLSGLTDWLSDALCRLATGGGFGTRTLHTDDDETVFDAKRPLVLNGIDEPASRSDLLERMVILRHPAIPKGGRRREAELWAEFEAARPRLLGALFDRVSAGLRALPSVDKSNLPRMADACAFAVACEKGMGEEEEFLDAFRLNQRDGHDLALADSPVAARLIEFMDGKDGWRGTPTELHAALSALVPDPKPREWPKGANAFTGRLRRVVPSLRRVHGLDVNTDARASTSDRTRQVAVMRQAEVGREGPSAPSGPSGGIAASDGAETPGRTVRTVADEPKNSAPSGPNPWENKGGDVPPDGADGPFFSSREEEKEPAHAAEYVLDFDDAGGAW